MKSPDHKENRGALNREEAFEAVPVRSMAVTEYRKATGEVVLCYPVVYRPWFARLAKRLGGPDERPRNKKLELDELGSFVWELIDGARSVKDLSEIFRKHYMLHHKEAEASVSEFLRQLGKRGVIGIK